MATTASGPISGTSSNGAINTVTVPNPSPPPEKVSIEIPTGPLWTLICGMKIGDEVTIEYSTAGTPPVHTATNVKRP